MNFIPLKFSCVIFLKQNFLLSFQFLFFNLQVNHLLNENYIKPISERRCCQCFSEGNCVCVCVFVRTCACCASTKENNGGPTFSSTLRSRGFGLNFGIARNCTVGGISTIVDRFVVGRGTQSGRAIDLIAFLTISNLGF